MKDQHYNMQPFGDGANMTISPIPSSLQALPSILIPLAGSTGLVRPTEGAASDTRPAVILSITPFAQPSATSAGTSGDQIAASARDNVGTYYALKSEIPNLHWDDVAKDVGEGKALEIRKAYEQRIEDFGKTAKLEAQVAGVSSAAPAIKTDKLPNVKASAVEKVSASSSAGLELRSNVKLSGVLTGADAALAVLRATEVRA